MAEAKFSSLNCHLTLQYSDEFIGTNVLDVRDLQKFFKRLRAAGFLFTYYAIGEYGTRDKRKHFHVAIFVKSGQKFEEFKNCVIDKWRFGYVYFTKLTIRRMGYILHYHVRPKIVNGKKTLAVMSNGLGSDWFANESIHRFILNSNSVSVQGEDGMFYTFPRYYRRKFGLELSFDLGKPKAVQTLEKIQKKKYVDLEPSLILRYYSTLQNKDDFVKQKYNNKSK